MENLIFLRKPQIEFAIDQAGASIMIGLSKAVLLEISRQVRDGNNKVIGLAASLAANLV